MTLSGTLVKQVTIKTDRDVFHDICRNKPHHISEMSPGCMKSVTLHEGEWGALGAVVVFTFIHEGKERVAKEVIHAIDVEKKYVCYKVIEGYMLEDYKTFINAVQVDTNGEDNVVTWTIDYEKRYENVDAPESIMDFCICMTKDIDTHHLTKSN